MVAGNRLIQSNRDETHDQLCPGRQNDARHRWGFRNWACLRVPARARGATVAVNFLADDARDRESVSRLKTQGIKAIEAPGNSWRWRGPRPHGGEGDRRPTLAASTCSLPRRAIRPSSTITTHASGLKHSVDQSPYCSAPASLQAHLIRCRTDQIRHNDYSGCGKTTEYGDGRPPISLDKRHEPETCHASCQRCRDARPYQRY